MPAGSKFAPDEAVKLVKSLAYRQFFMHKTGHWLGLDVHDVGLYAEEFDADLLAVADTRPEIVVDDGVIRPDRVRIAMRQRDEPVFAFRIERDAMRPFDV